jgi:hypothetical protein
MFAMVHEYTEKVVKKVRIKNYIVGDLGAIPKEKYEH